MTADTQTRDEKQDPGNAGLRVGVVVHYPGGGIGRILAVTSGEDDTLAREEEGFRVDWQPPAIMVWTGEVLRGGARRWRLRYLIGFDA